MANFEKNITSKTFIFSHVCWNLFEMSIDWKEGKVKFM